MLSINDLKNWLHRDLTQIDKLLLVLATFDAPCEIKNIKDAAVQAGFKIPSTWNPSGTLARSKGLAIRVPSGWEITQSGEQHLFDLGISALDPSAIKIATNLRVHLSKIKDSTTKSFVEEAIRCYELSLYRSAIVMSWLAAMNVLQKEVISNHLAAFNEAAAKADPKWKPAINSDDLGRLKEKDFLDRLSNISMLGKNAKTQLQAALDLRNGCGHPNSLKVGPNNVTHHIETLLLNVFDQFNP